MHTYTYIYTWHLVSSHFLVIIILLCVFVMIDANVAKESVRGNFVDHLGTSQNVEITGVGYYTRVS